MASEIKRCTQEKAIDRAIVEGEPLSLPGTTFANGLPVPLEDLCPAPEIDGRSGKFRCSDLCKIEAQTDLEATKLWIDENSKTESTAMRRRAAAEKLLNWAYLERQKALSSFERSDFAAFSRFLAAPSPVERWIGPRNARRGTATWRPFLGPLKANTLVSTVNNVRSLVRYLTVNRYADLVTAHGYGSLQLGLAESGVAAHQYMHLKHVDPLSLEEWHWIRRVLDDADGSHRALEFRLFAELLTYGSLQIQKILGLKLSDVYEPTAAMPYWVLFVRNRAAWKGGEYLIAPPPLSRTLGLWFREVVETRMTCSSEQLSSDASSACLVQLSGARAYCLVRSVCEEASGLAHAAGRPHIAQRLKARNLLSLRQMLAQPSSFRTMDPYMEPSNPFGDPLDGVERIVQRIQRSWSNMEAYWAPLGTLDHGQA